MWTALASIITGPLFGNLEKAYEAKLAAVTSGDQHALDLLNQWFNAQIEMRKQQVALASTRLGGVTLFLLSTPYIIFIWKCVVWDTVLGLGSTPVLKGDIQTWGVEVIALYTGHVVVNNIVGAIASRFKK